LPVCWKSNTGRFLQEAIICSLFKILNLVWIADNIQEYFFAPLVPLLMKDTDNISSEILLPAVHFFAAVLQSF